MSWIRHIGWLLLFLPFGLSAQTTRIQGRIVDAVTGEGIPYATVYFEGTFIGVSSDPSGNYSIEAPEGVEVYALTADLSGYLRSSLPVTEGKEAVIDFKLIPDSVADTSRLPDEQYLRSILYRLDQERSRHDPERSPAWQTEIYSKVQLSVDNSDNMVGKLLLRRQNDLIPELQESGGYNGYIPILLSEAVLHRYHSLSPPVDKEIFEASRISGLEQQNVLRQFTGATTLQMNFYRDILPVYSLSIPSPASTMGHLFYQYTMVDSLSVRGRKTYSVAFAPRKHITSPALEGRMEIDAEDFAIQAVHARLSPSSNINWIRYLSVDNESARREDGVWTSRDEQMFLDLAVHLNDRMTVVGVQVKRDLTYGDFVFGPFPEMEALSGGDKVGVGPEPDRDPAWWAQARPVPLTPREEAIFVTAEQFKQKRSFKWISGLGNMFITGYLEDKEHGIGYGPWDRTLTFNGTEGVRLQAGLRTTKEFSQKVRLGAWGGYGFGDREWKGGAYTEWMLGDNQQRTNKLTIAASRDYERLGCGSGVFTERNIVNSLLAPGGFDKQGLMFDARIEHQYEFSPSFNSTLVLQHLRIDGNQDIPLVRPDGSVAKSISANQVHWTGRFSWDERVNRGVFDKAYIFTRFPIITVDLLAGVKGITENDCSFLRGELTMDWRIPAGVLGFGRFHLNGGAILGSVPYPLLKLHEGNQSQLFGSPVVSLLDKSAFSLMNFYEFGSDRWVTSFYEHNFNGLLLGQIPLVKSLDLREAVTVRGAWGTLSDRNRTQAPFLLMDGLNSLEVPYIEAGVGITNIFHLFRVDCFWKLTHRNNRNFAVNIGLDVDF